MTRSKVGEERDAQTEQEVTVCDVGNYRNNDNKFFFSTNARYLKKIILSYNLGQASSSFTMYVKCTCHNVV